jgi:ADP-ribosylglycohydrolase
VLSTIQQIVQCGGDTDTIASMFGQIFGAAYGTGIGTIHAFASLVNVYSGNL